MYMVCKRCGSKHFLVNIVTQENGNEDTYEFVCGGCGDCIELREVDDYQTYLVKELDSFKIGDDSICLEEWVEEGARIYYVSLYNKEELTNYKDFDTVGEASSCYKKCTDMLETIGSFETLIKLFDDC